MSTHLSIVPFIHILTMAVADSIYATIWATAEPGTGIIAASIAVLRPLIRKIKTDVRSRITENQSGKGPGAKKFHRGGESAIGLGSLSSRKTVSMISNDDWDERPSLEGTHVGVGKIIVMQAAASPGKPLPEVPRNQ